MNAERIAIMFAAIRVRSFIVLAALTVTAFTIRPTPVQASPSSDIFTTFYDCALNEVGWKWRGCDSQGQDWGQLSGHFKEIEASSCEGGGNSDTWYVWNGTGWSGLPGQPSPDC
jgi:hypothetical protein